MTAKGDAMAKVEAGAAPVQGGEVRKLRKMIKKIPIAMLTTVAPDGMLRSRPMATLKGRFEGELWFLTRASTPKADEIKDNQRVGLSYASPDDDRYVSISGIATLVRDPAKIQELWSKRFKAWFPEGKNDPDLALIRVLVDRAEYWDADSGAMNHITGIQQAAAAGRAQASDNRRTDSLEPPAGGAGAQG